MAIAIDPGISLLKRLVRAAGWHSDDIRFMEALPHLSEVLDSDDLVATLRNLGVPVSVASCDLRRVQAVDCPAMFIEDAGQCWALLDRSDDRFLACDAGAEHPYWVHGTASQGTLIKLEAFASSPDAAKATDESLGNILGSVRGMLPGLILASFMTNLMALTTPLLIMVIYDRVIPTKSTDLIFSLVLAIALVVAADAGFRYARTCAVAHIGRIVEQRLGLALFRKLMLLPLAQIQKADVDQQVSRFKQFEGLREIFSGQIMTTVLDLPFTLIFLVFLFFLAPPVGLLIVGLAIVFLVATVMTLPTQRSLNAASAAARTRHQSLVFETVKHQRDLYRLGLGLYWRERHAALAAQAAETARAARQFQLVCQTFGQTLMTIAGVGAIVLGTQNAMSGSMSFGALIAVMALVWKVLTPLQALYSSAAQIQGFLGSRRQVDRVLALREELVRKSAQSHRKSFLGKISVTGVTYRPAGASDPALQQISLSVEPGEFVVICGSSSSGKTTLLSLIMGLYQPSVGSIQLDDIDLRQIAVNDLRGSLSYCQKTSDVFHGTILQNFRLAAPTITEDEALAAIDAVGMGREVNALPEGVHTRLTEGFRRTLSAANFQALVLARGFCKPAAAYLLDEPAAGLDDLHNAAISAHLAKLKGKHTIILVSDRPDHFDMADRLIFLDQGRIVSNDTGDRGRKKAAALLALHRDT